MFGALLLVAVALPLAPVLPTERSSPVRGAVSEPEYAPRLPDFQEGIDPVPDLTLADLKGLKFYARGRLTPLCGRVEKVLNGYSVLMGLDEVRNKAKTYPVRVVIDCPTARLTRGMTFGAVSEANARSARGWDTLIPGKGRLQFRAVTDMLVPTAKGDERVLILRPESEILRARRGYPLDLRAPLYPDAVMH